MTDSSAIIFSYALNPAGQWEPCASPQAADPSQPLWTHIDYSAADARKTLSSFGLQSFAVDTLIREESRPHSVATGNGLILVLRGINRNAGADPEDMVSVRIWADQNKLITVRQRRLMAATETAENFVNHPGPENTQDLLIDLITRLGDGIAQFVDNTEERIEALEISIDTAGATALRSQTSELRRELASVRRYLAPQRDALDSLYRAGNKLLSEEQQFVIREQADRMARYIEDLDLVRERALVLQEELMNRISQEQNQRTYVLSIVAAIFLPITFISGMFGMNTAGLPGLENEAAFWMVSAGMAAISVVVIIWLRAKKWF